MFFPLLPQSSGKLENALEENVLASWKIINNFRSSAVKDCQQVAIVESKALLAFSCE